jgi:hypothetical protein
VAFPIESSAHIRSHVSPRLLEARILAVNLRERFGVVFAGLVCSIHEYAKEVSDRLDPLPAVCMVVGAFLVLGSVLLLVRNGRR